MGILTKFSRTKYDDQRLASRTQAAIEADPMIPASSDLNIASKKGVLTISGTVHKESERDRIEGVVRSTLRDTGLKFDRIVNEIKVR